MNYESIYEGFYSKYYSKAEILIKNFFIKRHSQKRTFGNSINEVNYYFNNDFINKYNLYKNKNLETLHQIFCKRHSIYYADEVQEVFANSIKEEFDKIKISELPVNYNYTKFIKEIAIIEVEKEISRLLSNNAQLLGMFYKLCEFDEFEIKEHRNISLEDYPIYKKLHSKLFPEYYKDIIEENTTDKNYLGKASNEKADKLFDFLIQYYRPDEKTSVKFINILHYLKNDANKELYIFKVKQTDFKEIIKRKVKIEINKFAKSERYCEDERPILDSLESSFRREKS